MFGALRNLAWRRQRRSVWGIRVVKRLGFYGRRTRVPVPPLAFASHVDSVRNWWECENLGQSLAQSNIMESFFKGIPIN